MTSLAPRFEVIDARLPSRPDDLPAPDTDKAVFERLGLVLALEKSNLRSVIPFPRDPARDLNDLRAEVPPCDATGTALCTTAETCDREGAQLAPYGLSSDDPVIGQLSQALVAVQSTRAESSDICVDALKLAVAVRLFTLHSERQHELGAQDDACKAKGSVQALQNWRLKRVFDYIEGRLCKKITLPDLAAVAGLSSMYFAAQFRAATGRRPREYILWQRIQRAKDLLRDGKMPIVEIALTVGFQNQAHFTTTFKRFAGDTPSRWRRVATSEIEDGVIPLHAHGPRHFEDRF